MKLNKFLIATLLAMCVIGFSMSSVSAWGGQSDFTAHIDADWTLVVKFTFTNLDTGKCVHKQVAASDDHVVKIPKNWKGHFVLVRIHYYSAYDECKDYAISIPDYMGNGMDLYANHKLYHVDPNDRLSEGYWVTSIHYDYNWQDATLYNDSNSVWLN